MSSTLRKPMSQKEFFEWAEAQEEHYEFDGENPLLVNGGSLAHNRVQFRLMLMLHNRLSGGGFDVQGPNSGIAATGQCVRYPDAVVSRGFTAGSERLVSDVLAVFEVISPSTSRVDRIVELREYGAVESIRSYTILETDSPAATTFQKQADGHWIATALTAGDRIALPDLGIELSVAELYAGIVP